MNASRARQPSNARFVLVVGAVYGALSLGCLLEPDPVENNGPSSNNPTTNNPTTNNPSGGDCDQVVDSSFEFGDDTTLCGDVDVNANIRLSGGQKLTIAAGSTLTMCVDCYIEIGAFGDAATLTVVGTADEPITIKGETEEAGFWDGIYIRANATSNSKLEYVTIKDAGSVEAALNIERGITLAHVTLSGSGTSGLKASALDEDSVDLTVSGVDKWAAVLTGADAITNLPVDGDLTEGIGEGSIRVDYSRINDETVRFKDGGSRTSSTRTYGSRGTPRWSSTRASRSRWAWTSTSRSARSGARRPSRRRARRRPPW